MIWYIVTDSEENYHRSPAFHNHKLVLERFAKDCCLVLHYKQVNHKLFIEHKPWVICHSGGSAMYDDYDVLQTEEYCNCIKEWNVPQIGFCGGHQIISTQFGSKIGPLRQLKPNEPDLNPNYCPGQLKEWGIYPVQIIKRDPIFNGLSDIIHVQEYHSWEVKELGSELILLASSENCQVQAYVHSKKPIYGTQFHPEQSSNNYSDGFTILRNFFDIARGKIER
jgi:GMP synthase-like glutamine amidotransferase